MEQVNASDTLLMLGRLEGKVDTLINLSSAQSQRIDALEQRTSKVEVDIASMRSSKSTNQSVFTNIMAMLAIIVAAITAYVSYKP